MTAPNFQPDILEIFNHRITRLEQWLWYLATVVTANLGIQLFQNI